MGHKLGFALAINKMGGGLERRAQATLLSHTKFSSSSSDSTSAGSGVPAEWEGRTEKCGYGEGLGPTAHHCSPLRPAPAQLPGCRTPMERPRKQVAWRRWHEDM